MINAGLQGLVLERIERGAKRRVEARPGAVHPERPRGHISHPHLSREFYAGAVSGENVDFIERGFEAFNERGVEGILPFIHPEFEATTPPEPRL